MQHQQKTIWEDEIFNVSEVWNASSSEPDMLKKSIWKVTALSIITQVESYADQSLYLNK